MMMMNVTVWMRNNLKFGLYFIFVYPNPQNKNLDFIKNWTCNHILIQIHNILIDEPCVREKPEVDKVLCKVSC